MIRLLHTSDLHLGKRFANLPEEVRFRLAEARHGAIDRLAAAARAGGAGWVLVAGDLFDTETPSPAVRRQAFAAMAGHAPLGFVILPGNHDSLLAEELWAKAAAEKPDNVHLALDAAPLLFAPGLAVLPAPCTARRPGRDLTAWMDDAATAEGALRVGLAHGAVQSFSEDGTGLDIIAPDRARRAGLDYLALGDWHGQLSIGERSWYSGTPEPDRFKHGAPGRALLVTLEAPGAPLAVAPVETGAFGWRTIALELMAGEDPAAALAAALPAAGAARRQILLRLTATGRTSLAGRAALEAAIAAASPEFAHVAAETEALLTDSESGDLDLIDRAGALRQAAEALAAAGADPDGPEAERAIAREALARLFAYAQASGP